MFDSVFFFEEIRKAGRCWKKPTFSLSYQLPAMNIEILRSIDQWVFICWPFHYFHIKIVNVFDVNPVSDPRIPVGNEDMTEPHRSRSSDASWQEAIPHESQKRMKENWKSNKLPSSSLATQIVFLVKRTDLVWKISSRFTDFKSLSCSHSQCLDAYAKLTNHRKWTKP